MKPNPPARPRGKPRNLEADRIERELAVSRRRANQIAAESPDGKVENLDEMKAARLRKLTLEAERLALALDKERGLLMPKAAVDEEWAAVGNEVKAKLKAWAGSLPGRLEGLTAGQMVGIIEAEVVKVLKSLAQDDAG